MDRASLHAHACVCTLTTIMLWPCFRTYDTATTYGTTAFDGDVASCRGAARDR